MAFADHRQRLVAAGEHTYRTSTSALSVQDRHHTRTAGPLDASVVIPVHNAAGTLDDQLDALSRQRGDVRFEVILVLNRCTDESAHVGERFRDRLRLRIMHADDKSSAAYARNEGARAASAECLLFCDADDEVGEWWVYEMVRALDSVDFCGGNITIDKRDIPKWAYERFYRDMEGPSLTKFGGRILFPISASLACKRSAFAAVSGFDESFSAAAGEEVDLAIRLLRAGYRVGLAPAAHVLYRPRTSFGPLMRQRRGYVEAGVRVARREGRAQVVTARKAADMLYRCVRRIAGLLARRQIHPQALGSEVLLSYFDLAARCRATNDAAATYSEDPEAVDFVVPLTIPLIGGRALEARRPVARWYATVGVEQLSMGLVAELLQPGDSFVDVGANIGTFSVTAALRVGSTGTVIAFEPDPRTRPILIRNVDRHRVGSTVQVRGEAVGLAGRTVTFFLYNNDSVSGRGQQSSAFQPGPLRGTVNVQSVALDNAIPGQIAMMKIDVEGYELDVLRGARQLLASSPDAVILTELNPAALRLAGSSPEALMDYFSQEGSVNWVIEERRGQLPARVRQLDNTVRKEVLAAEGSWYGNLLTAPVHRREEVERAVKRVLQNLDVTRPGTA